MKRILFPIGAALVLAATFTSARAQTSRFYDSQGRAVGSATTDSQGTTRYYDERGRSTGSATPDSHGTVRYYDERGRSIGSSTAPPAQKGGKR